MRVAIMQPYFLPYIGYYQLIAAADLFIVYDNIKYTKKGWINRNRMLLNGQDATFSVPLKNGSDQLHIGEREVSAQFDGEKLLNQLKAAYARAPQFQDIFPLLEAVVRHPAANLFDFLLHSLEATCRQLGIDTPLVRSSGIDIDHALKSQDKVLALCQAVGAQRYINASGGQELYQAEAFQARGIALEFIQPRPASYAQFGGEFVPWLSIVDAMMFNAPQTLQLAIQNQYDVIHPPA
ncbi:WbqC-like protein [Janthinobacterium lividum]|uniref:WbqC family protein n=1 Tax=Janthinobacterium lividum TaxID=29581 RepID=UPI00053653C9|nr:WbqC family protein [Janthinobacterium lividum]KHA77805.1 WbqC-like protein [Janthinobacterium lividum]